MNSNFRRDYVYRSTQEELVDSRGTKVGCHQPLRYLRYDRKNHTYIFLTGRFKRENRGDTSI